MTGWEDWGAGEQSVVLGRDSDVLGAWERWGRRSCRGSCICSVGFRVSHVGAHDSTL